MAKGMLIVLCSICSTPLSVKEDYLLLYSRAILCPICNQISPIPQELKDFVKKGHRQT